MGALLYIPWFKAEPWEIPLPFELPLLGDTLPIQPFGVMVAIGVLLGAKVAEVFARRNHLAPEVIADFVTHVVFLGFVGAYLLNGVFYHPDTMVQVLRDPSLLLERWLGLSSYGGFLGAIGGLFVWRARRKLPILPFADATAFALPFGWLFGRMGCFVVHDHPGRPTDFFLAVAEYEFGRPPYVARHDLGLYEVLWSAACVALFLVLARTKRRTGFYVALLPILYTPVRFALDFLRAPELEGGDARYLALTPAQYASLAMLLVGVLLMRHIRNLPPPALPDYAKWPPPERDESAPEEGRGEPRQGDDGGEAADEEPRSEGEERAG